ncbi:hypothetical protein [Rhodohalobacter sp. 614A]|uniref:hypothetical protein n=1 Tax=Rhodohalobacter sp. 614A TaxID=2908649 RepID=UPI001F2C44F7|nr:hypothetical protein [Rhodohalobacter sp. 614A]
MILGEHDKGLGKPFPKSTVSGRRLRNIIDKISLDCTIENAFQFDGEIKERDLAFANNYDVVIALGRRSHDECLRQGINAKYLPHPAVRTRAQLEKLEQGLKKYT